MTDPICGYHVEGHPDEPDTYEVVLELHGESGDRSTIAISRSELVISLAELLLRAADDLAFAEERGLAALVDQVGTDESDVLTVSDILDAEPREPDE